MNKLIEQDETLTKSIESGNSIPPVLIYIHGEAVVFRQAGDSVWFTKQAYNELQASIPKPAAVSELRERMQGVIPKCNFCKHPENDCDFPDCVGETQTIDTEVLVEYLTTLDQLQAERDRMREALVEVREIYAGMDGFKPETAPEAYQERIINQMFQAVSKALQDSEVREK